MANELKGLANVSHEIRSPLNGIVCMASLLAETKLDEEQQDLLNIIQKSAGNLSKIIEDLLELAFLQEKRTKVVWEDFNLRDCCRMAIKNLESDISRKGLDFHFRFDPECTIFTGDQVRLGEILTNLLTNAVKYTHQGSIVLDIRKEFDLLVILVEDSGIGIPQSKQQDVFKNFIQLDNSYSRSDKGIGIGLSIVKQLVELMSGQISLKSQVGEGTLFRVEIPFIHNTSNTTEEDRELKELPTGLKILVADDEVVNRYYISSVLERYQCDIDEAENGRIALKKALSAVYDFVLMDISMPEMDGVEATRKIKERRPGQLIFGITAHAFPEDLSSFLDAGMDKVFVKPLDDVELINTIHSYLKHPES